MSNQLTKSPLLGKNINALYELLGKYESPIIREKIKISEAEVAEHIVK